MMQPVVSAFRLRVVYCIQARFVLVCLQWREVEARIFIMVAVAILFFFLFKIQNVYVVIPILNLAMLAR
jgi:hypothetical protein